MPCGRIILRSGALNVQWRKQRELSALSAEALNGYALAQSQLQRLSAQLDALDERKGDI